MNDANRLLRILYRGPLSSCNYGCPYCPFAKHHETAAELKVDRACCKGLRIGLFKTASVDTGSCLHLGAKH